MRSQSNVFLKYRRPSDLMYWRHPSQCYRCYSHIFRRSFHSTTLLSLSDSNDSGAKKHQLYLQQIQELESERKSFFGSIKDDNVVTSSTSPKIPDFGSYMNDGADIDVVPSPTICDDSIQDNNAIPVHSLDNDDLKSDREALYGFTTEERNAWSTIGSNNATNHTTMLHDLELARQQQQEEESERRRSSIVDNTEGNARIELVQSASSTTTSSSFSHLTEDQRQIHMVDVGSKLPTRRTATAQSMVIFPPEILQALNQTELHQPHTLKSSKEWIGPKGPIFATAITAGIMGVKQTSSLIPLCHPLPIENIHIDIQWYTSDTIQIKCTCSVTHKTGVEMEALMGCTIAALTVYDMVKAISHNVQITDTKLLYKDGGKRHVDER